MDFTMKCFRNVFLFVLILIPCLAAQANEVSFTKCYQPDIAANTTCPLEEACWNGTQSEWHSVFSRSTNVCFDCSPPQLHPLHVPRHTRANSAIVKFSKDDSFPDQLTIVRVFTLSAFNSCFVKLRELRVVGLLNLSVKDITVFVSDLRIGINYFVAVADTNTTCSNIARVRVLVGENNCSNSIGNSTGLVCSDRAPCVFNDERREFACQCAESYYGRWCQHIDECYNNSLCQHGGRCIDGDCSFECECVDGRSGMFCECASSPCLNGGICYSDKQTLDNSSYSCQCPMGYSGIHCETDINECLSSPCQNNGTCVDSPGEFSCNCSAGFAGLDCTSDVDECQEENVCGRNFCNNTFGSYTCINVIAYCSSANCNYRGLCRILVGGMMVCSCGRGFTGSACEYQIDDSTCLSNPCMNNGTCKYENHDYVCECLSGYGGEYCDHELDECLSNPCLSGQEYCRDRVDGFECVPICGSCTRPPSVCTSRTDVCDQLNCGLGSECAVEDGIPICQCSNRCHDSTNSTKDITLAAEFNAVDESYAAFDFRIAVTNSTILITLRPEESEGLILYYGLSSPDFVEISLRGGLVHFFYDLGSGATLLTSSNKLSLYTWHTIKVERQSRLVRLTVDEEVATATSPGFASQLNGIPDTVFVGGITTFLTSMIASRGFSGCISYLEIDDHVINLTRPSSSMAIGNCSERSCDITCQDSSVFGINNNKYACKCVTASLLPYCELDVDECALRQDTCPENTTCINTLAGFDCEFKCTCDICSNNGICREYLYSGLKTCECQSNFTGLRCETFLDGCWPSPCVHGNCVSNGTVTACFCRIGFTGRFCDIEIDECDSSPCSQHGRCSNHVGGYTCACKDGYVGTNCEINVNECASNPCKQNEVCEDDISKYSCMRVHEACDDNPCEHDSVCLRLAEMNQCYCRNGYHGVHCEVEVDECGSSPCSSESSCLDGIGKYSCLCPPGYTGRQCEIEMTDCKMTECSPGRMCLNGRCICLDGYTGSRCESPIDPCHFSSCDYGAACVRAYPSYTCSCPKGATGRYCEIFQYCANRVDIVTDIDDFEVFSFGESAILVSWQSKGTTREPSTNTSFPVLGYVLEYRSLDNVFAQNVTVNDTQLVLENANYFAIRFRIASINNDKDRLVCTNFSEFSRSITPNISNPSAEPTNVIVQSLGPNQLSVRWQPIDVNFAGGPNPSYIVYWMPLATSTRTSPSFNFSSSTTDAVISGLDADMWYKVEVSAVVISSEGRELVGPRSRPVTHKTTLAFIPPPENVQIVPLDSHQARVTWDLPSNTSISYDLTVNFSINVLSQGNLISRRILPYNQRELILKDLSPSTVYTVTVSIEASRGKSNAANETLLETFALNQWNVTIVTHNATALRVIWSVPSQHKLVNASVRLLVRERRRGSKSVRAATDVEKLSHLLDREAFVTGLLPSLLYEVQFTVLLPNNTELDLIKSYQFTDQSAPSKARNIRVVPGNDPSVAQVSWDAPENPNGHVGYRLRYYGNSSLQTCFEARERVIDVIENRQWLITDLKPFEQYTVEVTSYNLLHNISCCLLEDGEAPETQTFWTPTSRLNAPNNMSVFSHKSGGMEVRWKSNDCYYDKPESLYVFHAPVVISHNQRRFPLVFRHVIDLTTDFQEIYYISGQNFRRNSTYAFWIQLATENRRGFSSEIYYRTSLIRNPEGGVSTLSVYERTHNSMSLHWEAPSEESLNDDRGIFLYRITFRSASDMTDGHFDYYPVRTNLNQSATDFYTVRDLNPSKSYEVCVYVATIFEGNNFLLFGPQECVINSTDFLEPSASLFNLSLSGCPSSEWRGTQPTIFWNLNEKNQPGPISKQDISLEYTSTGAIEPAVLSCSGNHSANSTCDSSSSSRSHICLWMVSDIEAICNISGLMPYTLYTFRIRAGNTKGYDETQTEDRTCPDVPSASMPLDCQITSNSNVSFSTLLWKRGRSNSRSVTYSLLWIDDDLRSNYSFLLDGSSLKSVNDNNRIYCSLEDDIVICTVSQVIVGHSYQFRIISKNEVGMSSSKPLYCSYESSTQGPTTEWVVAISVVAVLFIVATTLIVLYYIYRWRPAKELEKELEDETLHHFELKRSDLDLPEDAKMLGSGAFGCVMMGWIWSKDENTRVAVKQLRTDASIDLKREFIREAKISLRVNDVNVVRLLHVCSQDEPYLMILEYVNRGNLKGLVKILKPKTAQNLASTLAALKCNLLYQIACGLQAVTKQNIVHRDIAARNCLIHEEGGKLVVKVSDFGMAVVIDEEFKEVRMKKGGGNVPFRWMSPEAAYESRYSEKSDIWSFGVLCWEVYSFGLKPYLWLSNSDLLCYISNRLPLPSLPFIMNTEEGNCLLIPPEEQGLLFDCWKIDVDRRPCFDDVVNVLHTKASAYGNKLDADLVTATKKMLSDVVTDNDFGDTAL